MSDAYSVAYEALVALVKEMRDTQRRYYRDRTRENLIAAKQAEAAVDGFLDADHAITQKGAKKR